MVLTAAPSLNRFIERPVSLPRTLFAMEHAHKWEAGRRRYVKPGKKPLSVAVIRGKDWFISGSEGGEELYDMGADPEQERNLVELMAATPKLAALRTAAVERGLLSEAPEPMEQDPELLKKLRSLGYTR